MSRLFLSHSSANNAAASALGVWLADQGFDDVFLDIDPNTGLVPGQRWQEALRDAADRCEAVLFLVSPAWLESRWCLAEFLLAKSLHKRIFGLLVEPVALARIPAEMTAEWQLCDLSGQEDLLSFSVTVQEHPATVAFPRAGLALLRRGLERAGLDASSFPWPPADDPNRSPYRGLSALEAEDAAVFFGRDAAIVRGLDCIRGLVESGVERVLVILGASGSGKSSFLRAGLWPRLARADTAFLPLPVIRSELAAVSGNAGLVTALVSAFDSLRAPRTRGQIKSLLTAGADPLGTLLDELVALAKHRLVGVAASAANPAIVISIDQAEELFNADGADEAAVFFKLLEAALGSEAGLRRKILVLATMRSDRYELLQSSPQLTGTKRALFDLPPIDPSEFKSVIEGPVQRLVRAGRRFSIDPALTEQLIAESDGADALPLLAFTLERLYADFGADGRLTLANYDATGRVRGAIEAAVNQALAKPGNAPVIPAARDVQFAALRSAFIPWLARIDPESGTPLRRVARLDEIPEDARSIVERLVDARLLVADRHAGFDTIEVAHESLLRQWPALTAWLEADRDNLKLIESVDRAGREWDTNGRHQSWLDHRAERLSAADELASRPEFHRRLGETGASYLLACRAYEDADRKERLDSIARQQAAIEQTKISQRRAGRVLTVSAALLTAFLVFLAYQWSANRALKTTLAGQQRTLDEQTQTLAKGQIDLDREKVSLLGEVAATQRLSQNLDGALRLAVHDVRLDKGQAEGQLVSSARSELAAAFYQSNWRLNLSGHKGAVSTAAFSRDGTKIVTASADGTARIWNATTGASLLTVGGHGQEFYAAAFSPDGTRIVTASADGTAQIWNAATGASIRELAGHSQPVRSVAFNRNGSLVVTASEDGKAIIWDAATGSQIAILQGSGPPIWQASFAPTDDRVVTASEDGTAGLWDAPPPPTTPPNPQPADGHESLTLTGHAGGVWSAAFSPDGSKIVTGSYDTEAYIWDSHTGDKLMTLDGHLDWITSVAFSFDGSRVVTASQDGTARLWDVTNLPTDGKTTTNAITVATLSGHEGGVLSAAFSPNAQRIVTASFDGTARVWNTITGRPMATMKGHTDKIWSAAFSPDGKRMVTASQDDTARLWDAASGVQQRELTGHTSWVLYAAFSPDSRRVVTASADDTAKIWDAETGDLLQTLHGHTSGVLMAEFDNTGTRVVTASFDKTARIWDVASGKEIRTLTGHRNGVLSAAFSPDGKKIVTSSYDETGRIWNVDKLDAPPLILTGHTGGVWDAHFNATGTKVVTGSEDRTARIWDVATGKELSVLRGHEDWVWSAIFSADGKQIVTGSQDKTARIWNADDGIEIGVLREIEGGIFFATFSPDGQEIATASDDKLARVWRAHFTERSTADLVTEICTQRLGGVSKMTRDEMRLAGYADDKAEIDVCAAE